MVAVHQWILQLDHGKHQRHNCFLGSPTNMHPKQERMAGTPKIELGKLMSIVHWNMIKEHYISQGLPGKLHIQSLDLRLFDASNILKKIFSQKGGMENDDMMIHYHRLCPNYNVSPTDRCP